jgi:hypothetical protein
LTALETARYKIVNRTADTQPAAVQKNAQPVPVVPCNGMRLQTASKVSSPLDPAEQEAESTSKKIMRMAVPESSIAYVKTSGGGVFRQVKQEEKDKKLQPKLQSPYLTRFADSGVFAQRREDKLQRKAEGQAPIAPKVSADIQASATAGTPLPLGVRRFMEPRFRADFGQVKIHTGDKSAKLNRQLNAKAFAVGNQIFFGKDQFKPESQEGKGLIAHELTHTIQQGAAIQRSEDATVTQQSSVQVQRLGISDALNFFADKANIIPGFRMFTIILGVNPINMSPVARNAANILRALIEFIPGGGLITQALDNSGIFEKVGNWVGQQIQALGMTGAAIKQAITEFLDTLGWSDIFDLGGVWSRAKAIFTEPIDRIINFATGLVTGIIQFIKDAILLPLAKLAEGTRGWDLLCAVLGKNPITGDPVPRTAETLIGGFMKLIGQEEIWENVKRGNAVPRAWAWFQGALAAVTGFVQQIPTLAVNAFKSLELEDIVLVPRAFAKVAAVFGNFIGNFISWAGNAVWNLLEIIFEVVAPSVIPYIKKAQAAFRTILKDPIGFVGNLVRAGRMGFEMFAGNILEHLKAALIKWIVGPLADAGVYIPKAFSLIEIVKLVLSVLGLTWQNIRSKLVKIIPEPVLVGLEKTASILVTLVKDGPAAAWEQIKTELSELKDQLIAQVSEMVTTEVVKAAVMKLVSMLNPAGAVVQAIIAVYNTITFFIEKAKQIGAVVAAFIDSIAAIAAGQVSAAASKVEQTLANTLTVVIAFLAKFAGLGGIPAKVTGIIKKIRKPIDKGLDKIVAWLGIMLQKAKGAIAGKLSGGKDKKDDRNDEQKKKDKLAAIGEAEKLLPKKGFDEKTVRGKLSPIKSRYKLLTLNLVVDSQQTQTEIVHFTASASEEEIGKPKEVQVAKSLNEVTLSKPFVAKEKSEVGNKLAMTRGEFRRQVNIQQDALSNLSVAVWRKNWEKFYASDGGRADESQASADRVAAIASERAKVVALWLKNNPEKSMEDANAFVSELFTPRPGDKSYPFLYKSLPSNGITYVNPVYGKTILHAADQAVGGGAGTAGLGGARENFSIGAQWDRGKRAQILKGQLDNEIANTAKTVESSVIDAMQLKVVLPVVDG